VNSYQRSHLSDQTLLEDLATHLARERTATAELLADLAEVDARKLYLPAAYPSLFAYCVGELHMSEDAAYKRIQAARAARRFPALLEALAEGRLHLTAVVQLAPHLSESNAAELMAAATHRTRAQIEQLLAERFPRPDLLEWVAGPPAASAPRAAGPLVSEPVGEEAPGGPERAGVPEGVGDPGQTAPATGPCQLVSEPVAARPRVSPLAPGRFGLQVTIAGSPHDKLRYAQELLGAQGAVGDLAQVLDRALDALIARLERRKFAATSQPRRTPGRSRRDTRHIPADVRRDVWRRDQGRCTFVSDSGRRCECRAGLQFDHVHEYARGGEATVSGIRLRCRAHNRYEAERRYGPEFMRHKRLAAAEARAAAGQRAVNREGERVAAADRGRPSAPGS
jgi:5-methylcytosine-specific restriction endonuclease McrA